MDCEESAYGLFEVVMQVFAGRGRAKSSKPLLGIRKYSWNLYWFEPQDVKISLT
jgi:hypothetical protein